MSKAISIVLTTALFGYASASDGCYPPYVDGGSYSAGNTVSATTIVETKTTTACTLDDAGCPASGYLTTTTSTSKAHNYECVSGANSAFCGVGAYAPNGIYSSTSWVKKSACSGGANLGTAPIPTVWVGVGCPKAYARASAYGASDVVSVVMGGYTMVYQCAAWPTSLFCGQIGYAPGTDPYSEQAWTALGSCTGTITPTSSPVYVSLSYAGGCPSPFDSGVQYEEGDKVSNDGIMYQCKPSPLSLHCSQTGYEPNKNMATQEAWKKAWDILGHCSGTITPTSSPNFVSLPNLGGCPDAWDSKTAANAYEGGDRVANTGLVYECKSWPFSGHCGQVGYEPNKNQATPDSWKDAWFIVGYCIAGIGLATTNPTASPNIDSSLGACPDEWAGGSSLVYEEGDMVSVTVSVTPPRKVAFTCNVWPYSGYCGLFSPIAFGGDQGWTLAGSCGGNIPPTSSPVFDSISMIPVVCPMEWSASTNNYVAGDLVAYVVSTAPIRKLVFECREWPNNGYCNQGVAYEPTTKYSDLAWKLKGSCKDPFLQDDYSWVVGDYPSCIRNSILLKEGDVLETEEVQPCAVGQSYNISALENSYQLILTAVGRPCLYVDQLDCTCTTDMRYVFEGVGSFNPKFKDEITFFGDHLEYLNGDGEWALASDTNNELEDVDTFVCTKASLDGVTIVCDGHINRMLLGSHYQMLGSFLLSEKRV